MRPEKPMWQRRDKKEKIAMTYRIFISCGQRTDEERRVGEELERVLGEGGHDPFFAGGAHSFDELATHIFARLASCEAYFAVMNPRGEVRDPGKVVLVFTSTPRGVFERIFRTPPPRSRGVHGVYLCPPLGTPSKREKGRSTLSLSFCRRLQSS